MNETLFPLPDPVEVKRDDSPKGRPRVLTPDRRQVELRAVDLDGTLPAYHQARMVWEFVMGQDLSAFYAQIRVADGGPGHAATDPRVLLALWLYATLEGVGSARALDRLTERDDAYRWICGGVPMNYHTLADFRIGHGDLLDRLLTMNVAVLMSEGLVTLERVAQDGVRVRASAGAASFRRRERLEECLLEADAHVQALKREVEEDPAATSRRLEAAWRRAAEDRKKRVAEALAQMPDAEAKKKASEKEKARVSTTDPDARVMKMGDGGYRPAFNGQFATDTQSQVVVGVDVTNQGSDQGQMSPMVEQVKARYDETPQDFLVDGGFVSADEIEKATEAGCTVYAPVQKPKDASRDPYQPLQGDSPTIAEWRTRMGTTEAKKIYKERAATAECVNALARNRGLRQFPVRGTHKVLAILLWFALVHNMMRAVQLRAEASSTA